MTPATKTKTTVDPKAAADSAKQAAEATKKQAEATAQAAKEKLVNNPVTKAAGDVFSKIKSKTGLSQEKVDAWQKSWLAMPENRKKYEHLTDAPQVVGEELIAMSNDIIDFVQGQEGGQSHLLTKLKSNLGGLFKNPLGFVKGKAATTKAKAVATKTAAKKTTAKKIKK